MSGFFIFVLSFILMQNFKGALLYLLSVQAYQNVDG